MKAIMSPLLDDLYRFDEFELSRSRRTLLRNGQPVLLLPKTFDVLTCLVSNPGRVVAKDELLKAVWPESFVEENNLTQHISLLRKALTDRSSFIVTIPGRGYQFTASVTREGSSVPFPPGIGYIPPMSAQPEPIPGTAADRAATIGRAAAATSAPQPFVPAPEITAPVTPNRRPIPIWAWFSLATASFLAVSIPGYILGKRLAHPPQMQKVLVADFSNSTGDGAFDHTLKRALEIDLEQSPFIDVMSEREANSTLQLMGRSGTTPVTPDLAREMCERSNRHVLLTGNIVPLGREYLLTVEATDCDSGKKITAGKAEAGAKEAVLSALDSVADRVRRGLGEPNESMQNYQVPIAQATTASLEALRSYSLGQSLDAQEKNETNTLPFYQHAIELDPQFAMAYGAMANEYYNLSEPKLASEYYKKAFDLSDRVSAKERLILRAHYYSEGQQDVEQGINTFRQWTMTYPNDWAPWVDLANDYTQVGQYPPAIAAAQQALKIQPGRAINYSVLARALKRANRFQEAKSVGADAVRSGKDSSGLHASLYEMAVAEHDQAAIAAELKWGASHNTGWYGWYFPFLQAEAAESAGHHKQAQDLFHSSWATAVRENLLEAADDVLIYQASIEYTYGLPAAARATLDHLHNKAYDASDLAIVKAELGDLSFADRYTASHSAANSGTILANVDLPLVRAAVEMGRGKPLDAVAALDPAKPYELASYTVPTQRAEAWMKADRPGLAQAEYQKIISNPGVDPLSPLLPLAHLGLARSYARQNKPAESRREYEQFLAQWKEGDSDIPLLRAARAEYTRIQQSPQTESK